MFCQCQALTTLKNVANEAETLKRKSVKELYYKYMVLIEIDEMIKKKCLF